MAASLPGGQPDCRAAEVPRAGELAAGPRGRLNIPSRADDVPHDRGSAYRRRRIFVQRPFLVPFWSARADLPSAA